MKTAFRFLLVATCAVAAVSCKKNNDLIVYELPQNHEPSVTAKIYPFVNQPFEAEFGTAASAFAENEVVTIYVPYGVYKEKLVSSTLTIEDAATGDVLASLPLSLNTSPGAAQLNVPKDLAYVPFMFASFAVDNSMTGKTLTVKTSIKCEKLTAEDAFESAFTVFP